MTSTAHDTIQTLAAAKGRKLLTAVSVVSLFAAASTASAQVPMPMAASSQQSAVQAQQLPQTSESAAPLTDDRFKPRVYGGTPQNVITTPQRVLAPAPAPSAIPAPTQIFTPQTTGSATLPVKKEQQVNVVHSPMPAPADATEHVIAKPVLVEKPSLTAPKPQATVPVPAPQVSEIIAPAEASTTTNMPDINPGLAPNSALNSAPNWSNGIRAQFTDVIVGAPIMVDPVTCEDGNPSLRIKVVNVKNSKGLIVADLHDDVKENFLDWEKVVLRVRATATEGETNFCMPVPVTGKYAVAIYHDKNSNAFFDKNFLGLPKERFGMSNNPKFSTKSPEFEQAVFNVPAEGVDMLIKLRKSSDVISGKQD